MFFEGTLQEGLAAAVQQSKLVISFVTGELSVVRLSVYTPDPSQMNKRRASNGKNTSRMTLYVVFS